MMEIYTIKPRIYTGYIIPCNDEKYLVGIDITRKQHFVITGFWTGYGNKEISSYQLTDENGEVLPDFEDLQFLRDRHNRFFLECVG